jgi:hypothetical protein
MHRRQFLGAGTGLLAGCGTPPARMPKPGVDAPAVPAPYVEHVAPFVFHGGFWLNLHHLLYALAAKGDQTVAYLKDVTADLDALSDVARATLDAAADPYRTRFASSDLLFDEELGGLKQPLAAGEAAPTPPVPPEQDVIASALAGGARPYAAIWANVDAANRRWIAAARELVRVHEAGVAADLARWYRTPWPADEVRVDVCRNANWAGAYTSTHGGVHVVIASGDPGNGRATRSRSCFTSRATR